MRSIAAWKRHAIKAVLEARLDHSVMLFSGSISAPFSSKRPLFISAPDSDQVVLLRWSAALRAWAVDTANRRWNTQGTYGIHRDIDEAIIQLITFVRDQLIPFREAQR